MPLWGIDREGGAQYDIHTRYVFVCKRKLLALFPMCYLLHRASKLWPSLFGPPQQKPEE
ncbi:MAG: hypothetical protein RLZZ76_319 [Candidatus Parcubacteria bacterium]|jgi:hypothetical protein